VNHLANGCVAVGAPGSEARLRTLLKFIADDMRERIDGDNPRWDAWLTGHIRAIEEEL
jgi:hypothetical protein